MNTSEQPPRSRRPLFSSEGIVGSGITIAAFGVLVLLLAWAQTLREVQEAPRLLWPIGVVLLIGGGLMAAVRQARKSR
ncbi:MAG: hypothetical protein ABR589_11730 [Chthoniobacterales bacterium]